MIFRRRHNVYTLPHAESKIVAREPSLTDGYWQGYREGYWDAETNIKRKLRNAHPTPNITGDGHVEPLILPPNTGYTYETITIGGKSYRCYPIIEVKEEKAP